MRRPRSARLPRRRAGEDEETAIRKLPNASGACFSRARPPLHLLASGRRTVSSGRSSRAEARRMGETGGQREAPGPGLPFRPGPAALPRSGFRLPSVLPGRRDCRLSSCSTTSREPSGGSFCSLWVSSAMAAILRPVMGPRGEPAGSAHTRLGRCPHGSVHRESGRRRFSCSASRVLAAREAGMREPARRLSAQRKGPGRLASLCLDHDSADVDRYVKGVFTDTSRCACRSGAPASLTLAPAFPKNSASQT